MRAQITKLEGGSDRSVAAIELAEAALEKASSEQFLEMSKLYVDGLSRLKDHGLVLEQCRSETISVRATELLGQTVAAVPSMVNLIVGNTNPAASIAYGRGVEAAYANGDSAEFVVTAIEFETGSQNTAGGDNVVVRAMPKVGGGGLFGAAAPAADFAPFGAAAPAADGSLFGAAAPAADGALFSAIAPATDSAHFGTAAPATDFAPFAFGAAAPAPDSGLFGAAVVPAAPADSDGGEAFAAPAATTTHARRTLIKKKKTKNIEGQHQRRTVLLTTATERTTAVTVCLPGLKRKIGKSRCS